ncbi:MAG: metallophosphoesterase [Rhizobiaceae bacterium]
MLSRRSFLKLAGAGVLVVGALAAYAVAIEPLWRLRIARYRLSPPGWERGPKLRIVALADFHACEPWMTAERIGRICAEANRLSGDIILLLGDFVSGMRLVTGAVAPEMWAAELAKLEAPLGVHAIQGNHDWWEDEAVQLAGGGETFAHRALRAAGFPVFENDAARLEKDGRPFWLAGLSSQIALLPGRRYGRSRMTGFDDLPATLAKVTDDAPVLLMAHEPDIFPQVPGRVSLTLSGHTHGGQVRLFGYSPVVPSAYGNRYAYGHIVEDGRNLVVSGGLGCSIMPVRFGSPPEITVIELG